MNERTRQALVTLSIPTDLIEKIGLQGHTLDGLRSLSGLQLQKFYSEDEAQLIELKIKRRPIPDTVVEAILAASNGVCAYCEDGVSTRPYQMHHIEPYSANQNNSEDNLVLVCPNHHAWLHKTGVPADSQKRRRREWCATAELGRAYARRGIPFPYGTFEPIDYGGEPNIVEILSPVPPSPRTAVELSKHALADEARRRLRASKFLLLVGGSGAGKSTLALGIAGLFEALVFRYRRPPVDTRGALAEVLTFVGIASRECVLLLDDANTWAAASDLERVAASASKDVYLLATWTGASLEGDPTAELHVLGNRLVMRWEDVRSTACATLLEHEHEVVRTLRRLRSDDVERVGLGPLDRSLEWLFDRYGGTAKSIWQFLFLLRGGWQSVRDELGILAAAGRADVPVVYAAIEQIASVERPVTPTETSEAIPKLPLAAALPPADVAWIADVFDKLVRRRLMVRARGAYTTVHRDWARALICAALDDPLCKQSAMESLARDFDARTASPRRLMILWSWLWYDAAGGRYARDWAARQGPEDWRALVGTAAAASLVDIAMVAQQLHLLFPSDHWTAIVGDAFEAHEAPLALLVSKATSEDWYLLRQLFMTMDHARPSCAARIASGWAPEAAARVLGETHPDYYESVWWFLAGVEKHSREWCAQVGHHLDWQTVASNLSRIRRGHIDAINHCVEILGRLKVPLLRSRVTGLAKAMADTLRGASVSEISFWHAPMELWLEIFPTEMHKVVEVLEPSRLAEELSNTGPRNWGRVLMLSAFAARAGSDFGRQMVDSLGSTFVDSVNRFGATNAHELRVLVWQLGYGSAARRNELAAQLLTVATAACKADEHERGEILKAFSALDLDQAQKLATDLGLAIPENDRVDDVDRPLLDCLENGDLIRKKLDDLDRSGEDYDVTALLLGWGRGEA
ncbi:MAG: HNH endonuclease [Phycisphaerae bacterium]|nr:HNH endonuclease [Phycisphaerae bacterium]